MMVNELQANAALAELTGINNALTQRIVSLSVELAAAKEEIAALRAPPTPPDPPAGV